MGAGFGRHNLAVLATAVLVVAVALVGVLVATAGHSVAHSRSGLSADSSVNSFVSVVVGKGKDGARTAHASQCTRILTSDLAVLARAQTAPDRGFDPLTAHVSGVGESPAMKTDFALVPTLERMARTLPNGDRVYIAVYAPTLAGVAAAAGDIVDLYVAGRQPRSASFGGETLEPFLTGEIPQPPLEADNTLLQLVPNHVAAVRWTFASVHVPKLPGHPAKTIPGGTLTASVVGNVAAAEPITGIVPDPSNITWLAHDGHVIRTVNEGTPQISTSTTGSAVTMTATGVARPISRC